MKSLLDNNLIFVGLSINIIKKVLSKCKDRYNYFNRSVLETHLKDESSIESNKACNIVELFLKEGIIEYTDFQNKLLMLAKLGLKILLVPYINSKTEYIEGYPKKLVKDILKNIRINEPKNILKLDSVIDKNTCLNQMEVKDIRNKLINNKYLEIGDHFFKLTNKGISISKKRMGNKIFREKAEKIIQDVLKRAKEINSSGNYCYRINRLIIHGSYLTNKEQLNDIDFMYELKPKYPKKIQQIKEREFINLYFKTYSNVSNFLEEISLPQTSIGKYLKNRSQYIDIEPLSEKVLKETGKILELKV